MTDEEAAAACVRRNVPAQDVNLVLAQLGLLEEPNQPRLRRGPTGRVQYPERDGYVRPLRVTKPKPKREPPEPPPHGTYARYQHHHRMKETPCEACKEARNVQQRKYRAEQRRSAWPQGA